MDLKSCLGELKTLLELQEETTTSGKIIDSSSFKEERDILLDWIRTHPSNLNS